MNNRLKALRKTLQQTQQVFAKSVGVKQSTIAAYEGGRNAPSDAVITLICRKYNVNRNWLVNGEGPMFLPSPESDLEALIRDNGLSPVESILIKQFLTLPDDERNVIIDYVKKVAAELNNLEQQKEESPSERDARLLREEADAVEQEMAESSASHSQERKEA